jgi:hypothetical protein
VTRRPTGPKTPASPAPAATPDSAPANSDADLAALDAFCAEPGSAADDLDFATWESCHDDLDLRLPLWLSADDAELGCVRSLAFSRSETGEGGGAPQREKLVHEVSVPAGAVDGQCLVLKGFGDRAPGRVGDLIVTLRIKVVKKT